MISKRNINHREFVICLILFLIGLNFLGDAIILIYLLAGYVFLFLNHSLVVPNTFIIIIILSISIIFSQLLTGVDISLLSIVKLGVYPVCFLTFYKFGCYEIKMQKDVTAICALFYAVIFSFVLGNMVHMLADIMITDLSSINMGRRIINDVWSGGTAPTTIIVGWGCLNMSVLLYALEKKRVIALSCSILIMATYLVFSFVVATRLGVINALFVVAFFVFLMIRHKSIRLSANTVIKLIVLVMIAVFAIYKLMPYIISSNLFFRLQDESLNLLDSNGRTSATIYLLQHFTEALWGGEYFTQSYGLQQHNVIFQMYDLYGIIPFLAFGVLIINSVLFVIKLNTNSIAQNPEKRFIIIFLVSLLLYFLEEPAITSNFVITSMLFVFGGYMTAVKNFLLEVVE